MRSFRGKIIDKEIAVAVRGNRSPPGGSTSLYLPRAFSVLIVISLPRKAYFSVPAGVFSIGEPCKFSEQFHATRPLPIAGSLSGPDLDHRKPEDAEKLGTKDSAEQWTGIRKGLPAQVDNRMTVSETEMNSKWRNELRLHHYPGTTNLDSTASKIYRHYLQIHPLSGHGIQNLLCLLSA